MSNFGPNQYKKGATDFAMELVDPTHFTQDIGFYEPCALWDVGRLSGGNVTKYGPGRLKLDSTAFKAQRYSVTLTHLLIDAVGYTLDSTSPLAGAGSIVDPLRFRNARDILDLATIQISRPFSRWVTRKPITTSIYPGMPRPVGHEMRYVDPSWGVGPAFVSPQTQVCRFNFERPFKAPHGYGVEFALGSIVDPHDMPTIDATKEVTPKWGMSFDTWTGIGRRFSAHAKHFRGELSYLAAGQTPLLHGDAFSNYMPHPGMLPGLPGVVTNHFPANSRVNPYDFAEQEVNQGADHTWFTGFGVMIDQKEYDLAISQRAPVAGETGGMPIAPLASRIPTRARVNHGGSDRDWWKAGAPLSLVCPTATPAHVHVLERPITLAPGERLSVELEVPDPVVRPDGSTADPIYQIGVSFTGYRHIVPERMRGR